MFAKFGRVFIATEKRKDRRTPIELTARIGEIAGRITNISLGGCRFCPDSGTLIPGEKYSITLRLDEGEIDIPIQVARHNKKKHSYGIAFLELTPKAFEIVENILTTRIVKKK